MNKYWIKYPLITLIAISVLFAIFSIIRNTNNAKCETFYKLITELENYKSKSGAYPPDLETLGVKSKNWLYYYPSRNQSYFQLAYSEGMLNWNTVVYSSDTKKCEKIFNY